MLGWLGAEVEAVESWLNAAVVVLGGGVHCSKVCLYSLCPGLGLWEVVEGECRSYLVGMIDMVVDSFETEGGETTVRCSSLPEMSF
jgi:hypothetical protein